MFYFFSGKNLRLDRDPDLDPYSFCMPSPDLDSFWILQKTHILKFVIESHVVPIRVWPPRRRRILPISFGWPSKMALIFPEPVRNFYFFVSLSIRLKAIILYSAMTLFYMSSREDSRTQLMCVLPHALVT